MSRRADRPARRLADRSGFTLVEVLVAFVVMTTVLGVLYRGTVQTRAGAVAFDRRMRDEAVALSVLAEFRSRRDLADGRYAGERDGRHWTLGASPMDLAAQLPKGGDADRPGAGDGAAKAKWTMQRLVLRVDTSGRPLETEALHLVAAPPGGDAR